MSERTHLYLIRHGQVEGHQERRYNGQEDVPLTQAGVRQFSALAECLKNVSLSAVYSSDLSRCLDGAKMLARPHHLEVRPEPALREISMGEWEGIPWKELQSRCPGQWQARLDDVVHYRVPGGENLLDVSARVLPLIRRIFERHRSEKVAVVSHGGVNRIILLHALGAHLGSLFSLEQNYGCLNIIEEHPVGHRLLKLVNYVPGEI